MKVVKYYPYPHAVYGWKELKIGSPTLFGAISNMWRLYYGEENIEEFFEAYNKGEVSFSSMFPFIVSPEKELLFFPRPILSGKYTSSIEELNSEVIKKAKKVKFFSEGLFSEVFNSIVKDGERYFYTRSLLDEDILLIPPFALLKNEEIEENTFNYEFMNIPHVSVDRFNISHEGGGGFFYTTDLFIGGSIGFYFLCDCISSWEERLYPLFRVLADEGIGGKRTKGKGLFKEVKIEDYDLSMRSMEPYIGLSLVFPQKEEREDVYTVLVEKDDGFIYHGIPTSYKKSPMYLIKEGAIYKRKVKGVLLEESFQDIKIYRNGKAFLLGGKR